MPKLHLDKRHKQLMETYLLTPSIENNRRNGESLSMTNRVISRGEVIDLKVSIIMSNQKKNIYIYIYIQKLTSIKLRYHLNILHHSWVKATMVAYKSRLKKCSNQLKYLLIPVNEIHETLMVIVVVSTLGSISWELQVVWSQTVPLSIRIGKDPSLEQLVI
jgi:hypothetical protein